MVFKRYKKVECSQQIISLCFNMILVWNVASFDIKSLSNTVNSLVSPLFNLLWFAVFPLNNITCYLSDQSLHFTPPPVSVLWWFRRFCSSSCHVWKVTVSGTRNTRKEVLLSCLPSPDIAFCSSLKTCNFAWTFSHGHGLRTVTRFSQWNDAGKLEEVAWNASFGWGVVRFVRFGLELGWRPPSRSCIL